MSNQASEDELRAELAQYLESTYQDGAVMATRPNSGYHKRVDEFTDKLLALIRTEKLKLLAEVRERVAGEDEPHYDSDRITQNAQRQRNLLRAEQMSNLTKLEAEL